MTDRPPLSGFACRDGRESLVLGERSDGSIAHISEVVSGRTCGCVCPGCGAALIARKGRVNDHHFAHDGTPDGSPCRTGPETALHKLAKEILGRRLRLTLPELSLEDDGDRWIRYRGGVHDFDAAVLEQRLGGIVPDVIVRRGDRDLLVEFAVTHVCGPEKIDRIRDLDIAAIEIDLSKLPRDTSRPELEAAILDEAPRLWIHNPLLAEGRAELERRREARLAKLRARASALADEYATACEAVRAKPPALPEFGRLVREGFGASIGLEVRGFGSLAAPPGDWQSMLLAGLFEGYRLRGTTSFTLPGALKRLGAAGWIASAFVGVTDAVAEAVPAGRDRFGSPADAVQEWAAALVEAGIVMRWTLGWELTGSAIVRAHEARERRLLPSRRMAEVKALVETMLPHLEDAERDAFSFDAWTRSPLPDRKRSVRQILVGDEEGYEALKAGISTVATAVRYGSRIPEDRLGLPVAGVAERYEEIARRQADDRRREAAVRREADARRRTVALLREAREYLGIQADRWAETPDPDLGGRTPGEAAAADDAGLEAALQAADRLGRRQVLEGRAAAERDEALLKLRSEVRRILPGEMGEVYLRCSHPGLGGKSPLDFCTTPGMVERCLAATLPAKKLRRR